MNEMESRRNEANRKFARRCSGFSMIELVVVVAVLLIVGALAVPKFMTMVHAYRLRGSGSDFSGIIQVDRIRSVQDGRFYSVRIRSQQAFVDLNNNGQLDQGEPSIAFSSEVQAISAANAPNTPNLQNQFLPPGSTPWLFDGSPGNGTPITFSSRGLPCKIQIALNGATGGIVCTSAGGATAFWVFFRNTVTGEFEAVTVTPAGRVGKWIYTAGAWSSI